MTSNRPVTYDDIATVQKQIDRIGAMTDKQLCDHIILGNFLISEHIHPDDVERLVLPNIQDWLLNFLPPSGSRKTYILRIDARCPRTRAIWDHGQETLALNIGLTKAQAARWAQSPIGAKYGWMSLLQRAIANPSVLMAYFEYEKQCRQKGFDVEAWADTHKIHERMIHERRMQFIKLLKQCLA